LRRAGKDAGCGIATGSLVEIWDGGVGKKWVVVVVEAEVSIAVGELYALRRGLRSV
jgi:hypothetical protein